MCCLGRLDTKVYAISVSSLGSRHQSNKAHKHNVLKRYRHTPDPIKCYYYKSRSFERPFTIYHGRLHSNANVFRSAAVIDGEKKYSPPFGTTQSTGSTNDVFVLLGCTPVMERTRMVSTLFCPMMGSKPGTMDCLTMGKLTLFAQTVFMRGRQ